MSRLQMGLRRALTVVAVCLLLPDIVAGLTRDRQHLRLAVVNATFDVQPLSISMRGIRAHGPVKVWQLGNGQLGSTNKVGAPPQVNIKASTIASFSGRLSVPPVSVLIYDFPAVTTP